jgi:hypothetical protein
VELGVYTHLIERTEAGDVCRPEILEAEDRADRVALELLAPRQAVLKRLSVTGIGWRDEEAPPAAAKILEQEFGLPATTAKRYGRAIVLARRSARTFQEWLGT